MSEPLYMVRNGVSLGLDMTPKFLWASFGALAAFEQFTKKQTYEYLFVYGLAGSIWTHLEYRLLNARKATKHHPKLFKIVSLNAFFTTLIRGFAEGGSFTLLGLMLGDKQYSNKWLKSMLGILFSTTVIISPYFHNTSIRKERISSVREIFTGNLCRGVAFWTLIMLFGFRKLNTTNVQRLKRSFISLCLVGFIWNWLAFCIKVRWISRERTGKTVSTFMDHLIALNYDAIFEIAAIYAGFISISLLIMQRFNKNETNGTYGE